MKIPAGFVAIVAFVVAMALWVQTVLVFYGWFVVPIFTAAPSLDAPKALGLLLFVTVARGLTRPREPEKPEGEHRYALLIQAWAALGMFWAAAAILHYGYGVGMPAPN